MYQPNDDNAHDYNYYMTRPEGLRRFDLRTTPERFEAWCTKLEQRIETLEAENATLRERVRRLEYAEGAE